MLAVCEVPRMPIRLRTFLFKEEFKEKVDAAMADVNLFKKGCETLKSSESFKSFLALAVGISNALNQVLDFLREF